MQNFTVKQKYMTRAKTRCRAGPRENSVFTLNNCCKKETECDYVSLAQAYAIIKYADEVFVTNSAKIEYCLSKCLDYDNAIKYIPIVENLLKSYSNS